MKHNYNYMDFFQGGDPGVLAISIITAIVLRQLYFHEVELNVTAPSHSIPFTFSMLQ